MSVSQTHAKMGETVVLLVTGIIPVPVHQASEEETVLKVSDEETN